MRVDRRKQGLVKYVKEREKILEEDFAVKLTKSEKQRLHKLATEISVDNFVRDIICNKL